jgi:hypothetical protein
MFNHSRRVGGRGLRLIPITGHGNGEFIQGDHIVSVHMMTTIQKVTGNAKSVPRRLQTFIDRQNCVLEDTRLTLTPSVIPNSNYVIVVSD